MSKELASAARYLLLKSWAKDSTNNGSAYVTPAKAIARLREALKAWDKEQRARTD